MRMAYRPIYLHINRFEHSKLSIFTQQISITDQNENLLRNFLILFSRSVCDYNSIRKQNRASPAQGPSLAARRKAAHLQLEFDHNERPVSGCAAPPSAWRHALDAIDPVVGAEAAPLSLTSAKTVSRSPSIPPSPAQRVARLDRPVADFAVFHVNSVACCGKLRRLLGDDSQNKKCSRCEENIRKTKITTTLTCGDPLL